jgi:alkylation response protein AidB-like acyl-CoA dehydrogenase
MDFDFNEEQKMFKQGVREFFEKECPKSLVKKMMEDEQGNPPELWHKMSQLGWLGLIFPEKYGGGGGNIIDLVALEEEMGRACLPGAFFSTVLLGGLFILNIGSEEQKKDLLPKIAEGKIILTLAINELSASYEAAAVQVEATGDKDNYVISGTKLFVSDAHIADYIICIARTKKGTKPEDGITAFLVDRKSVGVSCTLLKTIAGDKLCEVVFDKVKVSKNHIVGKLDQAWGPLKQTMQQVIIAKCAEMVGGAQRALEMAADHAKQRVQFDRPIGSFPVIQHLIANSMMDVDASRFLTYEAAWKYSEGLPCAKEIAMTKLFTSDACQRITATGEQVLGGIGYTTDGDMQLYYKRAKAAELTLGDGNFHRKALAKELSK